MEGHTTTSVSTIAPSAAGRSHEACGPQKRRSDPPAGRYLVASVVSFAIPLTYLPSATSPAAFENMLFFH